MSSYKSFCITIRPKCGLNDTVISAFDNWIRTKCFGGVYVFEMEDVCKHLHAQVFFKTPRSKSNVKKDIVKYVQNETTDPDWSSSANKVLGGGIRIAYNKDFSETYMTKDNVKFEYCNIPDNEDDYYPTQEEQECVLAKAHTKNPIFLKLKTIWKEEQHDVLLTEHAVAKFLQRLVYEDRLCYIMNKKSRIEQRRGLYCYMARNKSGDLYMTQEEQECWELEERAMNGLVDLDEKTK